MSNAFAERVSALLEIENKRKFRNALLFLAACAVTLLTAYLLVLPAVSRSDVTYCCVDEHEHSDSCYEQVLTCGFDEADGSSAVVDAHVHSDFCYMIESVLACSLVEQETSAVDAGEVGADSTSSDGAEAGSASETAHAHSPECYEDVPTLVCGLEEGEIEPSKADAITHTHSEACYEQQLVCGKDEHVHSLACFSNPEADVETQVYWESTVPNSGSLTGVWADDLISVAESQLGYAESTENYCVVNDAKKGYTRYGAWYGDAYGDWCAMFVSFCLHYAGIPESAVPQNAYCQNWIEALSSEAFQMYYPVGAYAEAAAAALEAGDAAAAAGAGDAAVVLEEEVSASLDASVPAGVLAYFDPAEPLEPVPGDIVFFNWDSDPQADHVGIVVELIAATEDEPARLKTIEGNASDIVAYREYALDDASIMGYASLPMNMQDEAVAYEAEADSASDGSFVYKTISSNAGALEGTTLVHNSNHDYQFSSYRAVSGGSGTLITAFVLVPTSLIPEGGMSAWQANVTDWTAAADANYVVGYCADFFTDTGSIDSNYGSASLDGSSLTAEQKRKLAAIIENSYPFISADEMACRLDAANVLESIGWSGVDMSLCRETEYLAAVQWAIWDITNPGNGITGARESTFPESWNSLCVNPLTPGLDEGCVADGAWGTQVNAIRTYLTSDAFFNSCASTKVALAVESATPSFVRQADGTYDLTVDLRLNRELSGDETVTVQLVAGGKSSDAVVASTASGGIMASSFSLQLTGMTAPELESTTVQVTVKTGAMQAYYLTSAAGYQNMLTANYEYSENVLAVDLGVSADSDSGGYVLPETGGTGNLPFVLGGAAAVAAGSFGLFRMTRRGGRGATS